MDNIQSALVVLILAYIIGSIPFGWIIVYLFNGKDLRNVESGRTGGTNAMRAAGFLAGALTAIFDAAKGFSMLWLTNSLGIDSVWIKVLAPVMVILGHNYSIFLIEKRHDNKLKLRGGAGGAPAFGGAMSLWPPVIFILLPIVAAVFWFVGYASVTTLSIAGGATLILLVRAILGLGPWEYVIYGVLAFLACLWALRPNLKRLKEGIERKVGLPARRAKRAAEATRVSEQRANSPAK